MPDVVVTVPMDLWAGWIDEGDLPADPWSGNYWHFFVRGSRPEIATEPPETPYEFALAERRRKGAALRLPSRHGALWHPVSDYPETRCYVVAHGRLRGHSPLLAIETNRAGKLEAFIRVGGAVALTIPEPIRGFRGWRYRWWEREDEIPFPDWKTAGVRP